ncbi:MAG: CBS domain-containing protein [Candidatus Anstonellales archaeon]
MGSGIKVGEVMRKTVVTTSVNSTITEAASLMKKHNIGSVIALDNRKAVGILTERDIVRNVVAESKTPSKVKISEAMSRPLRVITPEVALEDAAKLMKKFRVRRLPVINENGELVGIITENDIMKLFPSVVDLIEEKAAIER